MSIHVELYVVNERKLPSTISGSDIERYERLVVAVRAEGALWVAMEINGRGLINALETVDALIGGKKFLPIFAFNNSPANILGNDGDCPDFGYFKPEAAKDLATLLCLVTEEQQEALRAEEEYYFDLYWKFRDTAEEASRRGYAIAVLHDAPGIEGNDDDA